MKYQIDTTVEVTYRTIVDVDPYDDRDLDDILEEVADDCCMEADSIEFEVLHTEADLNQPTAILDDDDNFVRWV